MAECLIKECGFCCYYGGWGYELRATARSSNKLCVRGRDVFAPQSGLSGSHHRQQGVLAVQAQRH